jgi:glycosyltransferase involved in cell wall biosynthesis
MKNKGTLSVIMGNYNHGHFIQEALQAILSQSFLPLEVIVIDDGSTDNSVEIIESIAAKNPIVKLYRNVKNEGVMNTANKGTKIATGEYIYWAAADDRVCPGFFEKSVNILNQNPEAGLSSALLKIIDEDGNDTMWAKSPVISKTECFLSANQVRKVLLKHGFWFTGHTVICRREYLVKDANVFDPELYQFADHIVDIILATKHGACFIPEILATWRTTVDGSGFAETHFISEETKTNSGLDKIVQIMNSKEYALLIPHNFIKQYKSQIMYSVHSIRLNHNHNEMIGLMKTFRSLRTSENLLDKFVYLIINILNISKNFLVKSYMYYRRTNIDLFSPIRLIMSYRKGSKIYNNSRSNLRSRYND